jgi:hypothetical protein
MPPATIYSINQTDVRDKLDVTRVAETEYSKAYDILTTIEVGGKTYLLGYMKTDQSTDAWELTTEAPWVASVDSSVDLSNKKWDFIEPFVIGNQPHLMCYKADPGWFAFFPIGDDLSTKAHFIFRHPRVPVTYGFTMVKPLVALGQVFFIGYNSVDGTIISWTLDVTATSEPGRPPLAATPVWVHQWAKGWTRFAFFNWGQENFFLKTNTWKPNVNIDHLQNTLSQGSNEVGSYLHLKDDQSLNIVKPFAMDNDEPYFLTYLEGSGESTFNRFHANCSSWSTVASITGVTGAKHILPYRIGDTNLAMYVTGPSTPSK